MTLGSDLGATFVLRADKGNLFTMITVRTARNWSRSVISRRGESVLDLAEAIMRISRFAPDYSREILTLEGDILRIGNCQWDLRAKRRIFVVGAGKAANAMARAVEEVLGNRVARGLVIVKQREPSDDDLRRTDWSSAAILFPTGKVCWPAAHIGYCGTGYCGRYF